MILRVLDSISEGRKLAESRYQILNSETQSSIRTAFSDKTGLTGNLGMKEEERDDDIKLLSLSQVAESSPAAGHAMPAEGPVAILDSDDSGCEAPIIISSSQ